MLGGRCLVPEAVEVGAAPARVGNSCLAHDDAAQGGVADAEATSRGPVFAGLMNKQF
jgi:hypothetical protein